MQIIKRRWSRIRWEVPTWYLFLAWIVWVVHSLLVKRKPVLVQPRFFALDENGRRELARVLYEEMREAGWTYSGENQTGMYWRRQEHED